VNEAIAQVMNERFINVKVDREERPDLDEIYMNAAQVMTGSGGWPLTSSDSDLVPFHAAIISFQRVGDAGSQDLGNRSDYYVNR
jgi:hypothetical protein